MVKWSQLTGDLLFAATFSFFASITVTIGDAKTFRLNNRLSKMTHWLLLTSPPSSPQLFLISARLGTEGLNELLLTTLESDMMLFVDPLLLTFLLWLHSTVATTRGFGGMSNGDERTRREIDMIIALQSVSCVFLTDIGHKFYVKMWIQVITWNEKFHVNLLTIPGNSIKIHNFKSTRYVMLPIPTIGAVFPPSCPLPTPHTLH
jgi:hypothetical protein